MTDSKLAILVGGGPAPGINSVIGAATIRACLEGIPVLGIRDGFSGIMRGDISKVRPLDIETVSRIHFRGGSTLGTARANPTKESASLEATVGSLHRLGVTQLITIGGDDTAFSAMRISEHSQGTLKVVHVPKVLYHQRSGPCAEAGEAGSKGQEAGRRALQEHLSRLGAQGVAGSRRGGQRSHGRCDVRQRGPRRMPGRARALSRRRCHDAAHLACDKNPRDARGAQAFPLTAHARESISSGTRERSRSRSRLRVASSSDIA